MFLLKRRGLDKYAYSGLDNEQETFLLIYTVFERHIKKMQLKHISILICEIIGSGSQTFKNSFFNKNNKKIKCKNYFLFCNVKRVSEALKIVLHYHGSDTHL